ncbi:siderophore-interacting protein [Streptomyces sp. DT24]|uniref:siderophore-interacting protein n=1 Tax=unclassified Streptomyces TaxID=2593676 RepID=UPI0023B9BFB2|nr:siderophore-interacting protein [Streptomyces sp. AM 4-1-1]WEH33108.1 siderophore-interacting protein [Streptomyces sp. AM 4-1-1]
MTIHRAVVARVRPLTGTMVRITFHGGDLAAFTSTGVPDEYVRLFFPHGPDRADLSLPETTENGGWRTPEGRPTAPMRTYTVRAVRPDTGEIDIDFVLHSHGVASGWAAAARPGDVIGLNAPTGLYRPPADLTWQILVADLTGLPAVARIMEDSPAGVTTRAVIEVPGPSSVQPLPDRPHARTTWSHGGNGHGPSRLAELVEAAVPPGTDPAGGYIWVAGRTDVLREVRRHLRKELKLPTERFKVVGYWMPGAETWTDRYEALPAAVRSELDALWDAPAEEDQEDVTVRYEARLSDLGL